MTMDDERRADEQVDEASEESFPASDPPSTQPLHPGEPDDRPAPRRHDAPREDEPRRDGPRPDEDVAAR